jgi:GNAT superfamily N-acetyltransferase
VSGVRPAAEADLALLTEIERAADEVFAEVGIVGLPAAAGIDDFRAAAAVLVVGDPPVGFARIDLVAGEPYLTQLSVHPSVVRRGIGAALLEAAATWASSHGHNSIFLATFRDIAWNAPFYARHGFAETGPDTPGTREIAEHERSIGMHSFGARVLMRRAIPTCGSRS